MVSQEKQEKSFSEKVKSNPWMLATIVLGIITLVLVVFIMPKTSLTGNAISEKDIGNLALDFANSQLLQSPGTLGTVKEVSGIYEVEIFNINGKSLPLYLTKDGKFIYPGTQLVSITDSSTTNQNSQPTEVPKTDKPVVELFVMSFCPYGVNAENNILPVIGLLKDKIDFRIRFIVNVAGNTINDVNSLHGIDEAKEDARQLAIMKYYPDKYYNYLKDFDANCYPVASDSAKLETCWKSTAIKYGIDTNKIETAAYGQEGIALLKAEEAETSKYQVSGSPTLVINGVQSSSIYSGTSATQAAICSSFNTAPSECGTVVSSSGSNTPTGSCG